MIGARTLPSGATPRTAVLTALTILAFASNSILCRLALLGGAIDPVSFTAIRVVSGAAALAPMVGVWRRGPLAAGTWVMAAALAAYAVAFSFAYVRLDLGTGALLLFGSVQATLIGAALSRGDRVRAVEWVGLIGAMGGLVYLVAPGLTGPPLRESLLMIAAGASWGVYTLRGRAVREATWATASNFLRAAPIVVLVSVAAALAGRELVVSARGVWLAVASGVVASAFGYVAWYAALRGLTNVQAATVQLSVPAVVALAGVALLGETLTPRLLTAAVLILGGVALTFIGRET